jgi:hypothetical protein
MKKYLFAVAVCAAVAAGAVRADFGTPPAAAPGTSAGPGNTTGQYGWNPIVKRIMFWKKKDDCGTGSCGTDKCGPRGCAPQAPAGMLPGTLVFPTHPFNRSPRDYFMYGHGGS